MSRNVYITNASANRIISYSNIFSNKADKLKREYWKTNLRFFNKKDENEILFWIELLRDEQNYIQNFYEEYKAKDSRTKVKPEKFPSYHYDQKCKLLNSDYEGHMIPDFIREIDKIFKIIIKVGFQNISDYNKKYLENNYKNHKEKLAGGYYDKMHQNQGQYHHSEFDIINKFRNWFDRAEKEGLLDASPDVLKMRAEIIWGKAIDVDKLRKEGKNSGTISSSSVTKEEVEKQISKLIEGSHEFRFKNGQNQSHILSQFIKWTHLGLTKYEENLKEKCQEFSLEYSEDLRTILKKFHTQYKLPLIKKLKLYWQLKLNGNLSFKESFFKNLKFKPCNSCTRPDYIDAATIDELTKDFGKKDN